MTCEWKISWGGREWWTQSEPNAWVLAEALRRQWPDRGVITVEHSTPHGFYDAERDLSVDGHLIERWEWRLGTSAPIKVE